MLDEKRTPVGPLRALLASTLAVWLLTAVGTANAQELSPPRPHQGYYIGLGAYGVAGAHHDRVDGWTGAMFGPGGSLRMGEALLPWLDLGIGFAASGIYDEQYVALVGHVSLEVQVRPVEPLFVRASVGFGFTDFTRRESGVDKPLGRIGGSYGVAVGWDFYPAHDEGDSGGLAISPVVWFEAGPSDEFTTLAGGIGIEISWWTGLPREQLDLPVDEAFEK
jgi:hypothetical protein